MLVQFLSEKSIRAFGTTLMRCTQPLNYLSERGWHGVAGQIHLTIPNQTRVTILHRVGLDEVTASVIDYARNCGSALVYDTDDFIFSDDTMGAKEAEKRRLAMQRCDVVTVSTDYLAEEAKSFCSDVRVMRNGLSRTFVEQAGEIFRANSLRIKKDSRITIGYCSGSPHHDSDLAIILPILIDVLEANPQVDFHLIGKINLPEELKRFGQRVVLLSFLPYEQFPNVYTEIDINIVPLNLNNPIALGRSELKYIEAGACGVATVASPSGAYRHAISYGVNGILAANPKEWQEALQKLIDNPNLRYQMGLNAHKHVFDKYGPKRRSQEWDALMRDVASHYRCENRYWQSPLRHFMDLGRIFLLQRKHSGVLIIHRWLRKYRLNRTKV